MKERVKEILEKHYNITIENNPDKNWIKFGDNVEELEFILNAALEFAKKCCELQKIECADNAEADFNIVNDQFNIEKEDIEIYVLKGSIIQCKNVIEKYYK